MFTNGLRDQGSIKVKSYQTQKIVLDAALLNTQHYKVSIMGKVKQSKEGVALSLTLSVVAIEKEAFGLHLTIVTNFTYLLWIELLWPENPANTCTWHMETLNSCFDPIRSHQQCILSFPHLEIEPVTTECRAETLQVSQQSLYHKQVMPN